MHSFSTGRQASQEFSYDALGDTTACQEFSHAALGDTTVCVPDHIVTPRMPVGLKLLLGSFARVQSGAASAALKPVGTKLSLFAVQVDLLLTLS